MRLPPVCLAVVLPPLSDVPNIAIQPSWDAVVPESIHHLL